VKDVAIASSATLHINSIYCIQHIALSLPFDLPFSVPLCLCGGSCFCLPPRCPWDMLAAMDAARIAALLEPFLRGAFLSAKLAAQLQTYLDLLLRWNARTNLTSIRNPEQIVTRHFGESLFAARLLQENGAFASSASVPVTLADVGSGAGFPGIPIKLLVPELHLTLIESQNKKATFLREVLRALDIQNAEVYCGRAEDRKQSAAIVTMRAVEKFSSALPVAVALVAPGGMLCLLVGASQVGSTRQTLEPEWQLRQAQDVPLSQDKMVLVGNRLAAKR